MKKILFVGIVVFVIFVAMFRERLFLRDPLGKVERSGVALDGARVYINYSNDVLVESDHQFTLVQNWNKMPGGPQHLACLTALMCWTDADQAAILPLNGSERGAPAAMSAKEVSYTDGAGAGVRVTLR